MPRHGTDPARFSANVDRAVQARRDAEAAERARQGRATRVESSRGDR